MASQRRGPWSNAEDAYLMQLVHTHGALNWVRIAQTLGSRTPKQCRERYHQNLKPTLNHDPITPEEGLEIERLVVEIGKRWAEIARRLKGRSDNAVKNWWNGSQNRRRRLDRRRSLHAAPAYNGEYSHPRPAGPTIPMSPLGSVPRLPPPTSSASFHHGTSVGAPRHRGSWGSDAPLPSPCSSESAVESDSLSNYTTSPVHTSISIHRPLPVELPPLRTGMPASHASAQLPRLSSLSSPVEGLGLRLGPPPVLAPLGGREQLPTAPNSPMLQQTQHQALPLRLPGEQSQGQSPGLPLPRDSRMNLAMMLR